MSTNDPLILKFIDFDKAFDTVEHKSVINIIRRQGVQVQYVELLKYIYCRKIAN